MGMILRWPAMVIRMFRFSAMPYNTAGLGWGRAPYWALAFLPAPICRTPA